MAHFLQSKDMTSLLQALQYDGPPELLSMWLCLLSDTTVGDISWDAMTDDEVAHLSERAKFYTERHGQPPHPAYLNEV